MTEPDGATPQAAGPQPGPEPVRRERPATTGSPAAARTARDARTPECTSYG